MKLTVTKIDKAKKEKKDYKLADGHGLYLQVTSKGAKLWRWKYRFQGKEKLMSFGAFPLVTLAEAREALETGRRKLIHGVDPMAEKKAVLDAREVAEVFNPFRKVQTQWFEKWSADKDERYVDNTRRRIDTDILPVIGDRPINDIRPPEIVEMILAIEKRGAADVARRALQMTDQIFRYGLTKGLTPTILPARSSRRIFSSE